MIEAVTTLYRLRTLITLAGKSPFATRLYAWLRLSPKTVPALGTFTVAGQLALISVSVGTRRSIDSRLFDIIFPPKILRLVPSSSNQRAPHA